MMNVTLDGTTAGAMAEAETTITQDADWRLIVDWCHRLAGRVFLAAWAHQDGYGRPGYVPPQGFDWSGIRDSSPQAVKKMARAIRDVLVKEIR